MALITELIDGYADMTAEQKLEALEAMEQPRIDDAEVKKWKTQYDKTAHDLADIKKANKALQEQISARMTEDERAKAEEAQKYADIIKENEALKRESAINRTVAQYVGLGYSQELAESTANALYDNDIDTVVANTNAFKESFEQTIRAGVVKSNPVPDGRGSGTKTMTKADIMAIKDGEQRRKMIAEHMDLFTK